MRRTSRVQIPRHWLNSPPERWPSSARENIDAVVVWMNYPSPAMGNCFLSRSGDKTVRVWSVENQGEPLLWLHWDGLSIHAVLSPDGMTVVLTEGTNVYWVDVKTGKQVAKLVTEAGNIRTLRISPDGKSIILHGGPNERLARVDALKHSLVYLVNATPGGIMDAIISPDGELTASSNEQKQVVVRDLETGKEKMTIIGGGTLGFSHDGKYIMTGGGRGSVLIFDTTSGKKRATFKHGKTDVEFANFLPDDEKLITSSRNDSSIYVWSIASEKPLRRIAVPGHNNLCAALTEDGKTLATGGNDGMIRLWDVQTGNQINVDDAPAGPVTGLAFSPSGSTLTTVGYDGVIRHWDLGTRKLATSILPSCDTSMSFVAYSSDGRQFATNQGHDSSITIWNARTNKPLRQLRGHENKIYQGVFIEGDKTLISVSTDGTARFWDVDSGKERQRFATLGPLSSMDRLVVTPTGAPFIVSKLKDRPNHIEQDRISLRPATATDRVGSDPYDFASRTFSADGYTLSAIGTELWDSLSGELIHRNWSDEDTSFSAFSPDGRLLATGGKGVSPVCTDWAVRLWDVVNGSELARFSPCKPGSLSDAWLFRRMGKCLATGMEEGSIFLWDVAAAMKKGSPPVRKTKPLKRDCWNALAEPRGVAAREAIWQLANSSDTVIAYLKERLLPVRAVDATFINKLIDELDDPDFDVREKAQKGLADRYADAEPILRKMLMDRKLSPETRRRISDLLTLRWYVQSPDVLAKERAVQALASHGDERIASPVD